MRPDWDLLANDNYGFENEYGSYRARFTTSSAGSTSFKIANVKKWAKVFVNGKQVELNNSGTFNSVEGKNTIAILALRVSLVNAKHSVVNGQQTPKAFIRN